VVQSTFGSNGDHFTVVETEYNYFVLFSAVPLLLSAPPPRSPTPPQFTSMFLFSVFSDLVHELQMIN
jgi:hypothetical protein